MSDEYIFGTDWLAAQRAAIYDTAREAVVQRRLQMSYRVRPLWTPLPPIAPTQSLVPPPSSLPGSLPPTS